MELCSGTNFPSLLPQKLPPFRPSPSKFLTRRCKPKSGRWRLCTANYYSAQFRDKLWQFEVNSDNVVPLLRLIPDPIEALSLFRSMAEQPNKVHTTKSCNYMLELLQTHGKISEMAEVFDLMQKMIVNRSSATFLSIFKGLFLKGGLKAKPFALQRMKDAGFILNPYLYNGLIYFLI